MSWTEELVKRYQGSIKVVHYVRDPRGIMTSRRYAFNITAFPFIDIICYNPLTRGQETFNF